MKRTLATFLLLATPAFSLFGQSAQMEKLCGGDSITVTGTGKVSSTPDRVTFTAGVETTAPTVDDAVAANTTRMTALIAALKKAGATDKDLRTSNFSIYPQQAYEQGQPPRITGFQVQNSVTVSRQNPTEAGRLLTVAVNAGANQVSGLNFGRADETALRNKGLEKAVADARTKAQLLSTAAGRTLGRAMVITEAGAPMPTPRPMYGRAMAMESAKMADVPVEGGEDELSFSVTVMFELK